MWIRTSLLCALAISLAFAQNFEQRALDISRGILERHVPFGTILDPLYVAPDSTELLTYTRCGDSAIWTGHWLAAEAFRYRVTGSTAALDSAKRALSGVRGLINVTGTDDLLARCILRTDSPYSAGPRSEEAQHGEYLGQVDGVSYYWIGDTSRDQYMGVFFGLSVAYEAIPDAASRATITDLVTRLIDKLLARRWAVVMPDGKVSTAFWLRPEQQLAILQVGRQVNPTRFTQLYRDERQNATGLSAVIRFETIEEHKSYFKFNLDAITLYTLLHLEEANSPKREEYYDAYRVFRSRLAGHGNAFFNVIDRALTGADPARDQETSELLSAWLLKPTRDYYVDWRGKYPACGEDRACKPIPVPDRVRTDFLWQRSPFLLYGGGEGRIEAPGIDFILPYWMARNYGQDLSLGAVSAGNANVALAPGGIGSLYGSKFPQDARVWIPGKWGTNSGASGAVPKRTTLGTFIISEVPHLSQEDCAC